MSVLSMSALAFSMSADAFAAAISKGVTSPNKPKLTEALRIGAIFGSIETVTPIIGWCIGLIASSFIATFDHWLAFIILSVIGGKMLYESINKTSENDTETTKQNARLFIIIMTAIGTSIDSMAVGVTLALINVNILIPAIAIGMATFTMATIGIMAGHYIGTKGGRIAEAIGGVCLIAIGLNILIEHLSAA